jgi:hypothetical protein
LFRPTPPFFSSSYDLLLRFDTPYNGGGCEAQNDDFKRRRYSLDDIMLDRSFSARTLSNWFASVDWVPRSWVWSSLEWDAMQGEEGVVVVGVVPGDLGLGRGDELGEGGWVRREIRRLKQNDGVSS